MPATICAAMQCITFELVPVPVPITQPPSPESPAVSTAGPAQLRRDFTCDRRYRHWCLAGVRDGFGQVPGVGRDRLHLHAVRGQSICTLASLSVAVSALVMVLTQWPQVMSLTSKAITVCSIGLLTRGLSTLPLLEGQATFTGIHCAIGQNLRHPLTLTLGKP